MSDNGSGLSEERIAHLDDLVHQAKRAAAAFSQCTQEEVDRIVKPMVIAGLEKAQYLARLAIEETKIGVLEDKAIKNMVATEFVYNYVKDKRTVGVIREDHEHGLVELAEPIGVILSLTPITNPTSTVLFKCIMAIKTRNAAIFSPHPAAWRCCAEAVRIMYETAVKHGAPEGVFTCLESHTLHDNAFLMRHKDIGLIDATGGPGVVKAAYGSGKPALGVGPGNTPVYLEKSADLDMAVVDIITSKTFDNGTICASEQTIVIDDAIYDSVLKKFEELGSHICNEQETKILSQTVIDPATGYMQPMAVGQKATNIARFVGIQVKPKTKLLIAPIAGVGREYPLSVEKLFPVLAVYRAHSVDEALKVCVDVNHSGGLGHTAVVFSNNEEVIRRFADVINAGRIIVNSPGSIGALGGVYNDMVPTFSFGCGTGGGNSTTDNVNVYHYLNIKRMARRTQAHMWFRVPNQIYFNMHAVENLRNFASRSTLIITNAALEQIGHSDIVRRALPPETQVRVTIIPDAEPDIKIIAQGVEALNFYKADQIIALGGGSVIDAAKIMKLKYESPRGRPGRAGRAVPRYPQARGAVPHGENEPRAPYRHPDHQRNRQRGHAVCGPHRQGARRKVTLADYSLTPDVAIVDPQFVMSMPKGLTADTGIDCLTHALEAGVSIYASPYTDSNAMQAIRLVFNYLPDAYDNPARRRSAQHDAQRRLHCGDCVLECLGRRESRPGTRLRRALRRAAWSGQCPHAAARHRLQRSRAHQVHALAESAGLCRTQKIRDDRRPDRPRRSYRRREGTEPGFGHGTTSRQAGSAPLNCRSRHQQGDLRGRAARPHADRLRRPILALESTHAAGEGTSRALLGRFQGQNLARDHERKEARES